MHTIASAVTITAARTMPWKVGTIFQVDFGESTKWCRSQGRRKLRTIGMLFQLQLDEPMRYQRVSVLDLDKFTACERIISRCREWPLAQQEILLHSDREIFFTLQKAINNLSTWLGASFVFSCTTHQGCFGVRNSASLSCDTRSSSSDPSQMLTAKLHA